MVIKPCFSSYLKLIPVKLCRSTGPGGYWSGEEIPIPTSSKCVLNIIGVFGNDAYLVSATAKSMKPYYSIL